MGTRADLSETVDRLQVSWSHLLNSLAEFAFLFPRDLLDRLGLQATAQASLRWGESKGPSSLEDVFELNDKLMDFTESALKAKSLLKSTDKLFLDIEQKCDLAVGIPSLCFCYFRDS